MDGNSGCVGPLPTRVGWEAASLHPNRAVAQARRRAMAWVREQWRLGEVADAVEIVVGELCANAVRHGDGLAGLELVLRRGAHYIAPRLTVLVADYNPLAAPTVDEEPDVFGERGRGLVLVESLADGWGWHHTSARQKQVWCNLSIPTADLGAASGVTGPG